MKRPDPKEFYVGYRKRAPEALARFVRARVALAIALGVAIAATIAATQSAFEPGEFEFGRQRSFAGTVLDRPYPLLHLDPATAGSPELVYLVAFGKHGADEEVAGREGRPVRLSGTRIQKDDQLMIEIAPGSVEVADTTGAAPPPVEDLGERTLVGEIVDSKCYLGVMRPGRRRPHRACAALCLRGGIPPMLVTVDPEGERWHLLLTDAEGGPIGRRLLDLVAEPVVITGRVTQQGNLYYLAADRAAFRRHPG